MAAGIAPKAAANWVTGEFSRLLNQHAADGLRASDVALTPEGLAELIGEVDGAACRAPTPRRCWPTVFASGESPRAVIEREGLGQVRDTGQIEREVAAVLAEFPEQVAQYRGGKQQIYGFLVGQVMKRTAGRADAKLVNGELRRQLDG